MIGLDYIAILECSKTSLEMANSCRVCEFVPQLTPHNFPHGGKGCVSNSSVDLPAKRPRPGNSQTLEMKEYLNVTPKEFIWSRGHSASFGGLKLVLEPRVLLHKAACVVLAGGILKLAMIIVMIFLASDS